MKLPSNKESEILQLLSNGQEQYGLEMVKASASLKRGTIYVTLARMEEHGYVTSRTEKKKDQPGLPRRLYRITGLGERALYACELAGSLLAEAPL